MKIYVTHSKDFEYAEKLYKPIRESGFSKEHEITLPYEHGTPYSSSKDKIKECHLLIAEVSKSSTGSGIEIGWADMLSKPVVAYYQNGTTVSNSLKFATKELLSYGNSEELLAHIGAAIKKFS